MPRSARQIYPDVAYLISNSSAGNQNLLNNYSEYRDFGYSCRDAARQCNVLLYAYALMSQDVYFIVRSSDPESYGRWMRKVMISHALRFRANYGGRGAVWQGRYAAIPVQDSYLAPVLSYLRALPHKPEHPPHSTQHWQLPDTAFPADGPDWGIASHHWVRACVARRTPIGDLGWSRQYTMSSSRDERRSRPNSLEQTTPSLDHD
jgi:hypothetical protein